MTPIPEQPKRIPYSSTQVGGVLVFVLLLTLFFWGLFIWSITEGEMAAYAPITAIGSTVALIMGYARLKKVKAQEAQDAEVKGTR